MFVPLSVLEFRDRAAAFFGDKIGVIDGDRQFTYREFAERTHRLARALQVLGVNAGERVSFITYNTHHLLEAYYGVLEAGAALNPINIRVAPHQIAYILDHAGSKVVAFHRAAPARDRRERHGRAVLHQRHDGPAQGRRDDPPRAVPAQLRGRAWPG